MGLRAGRAQRTLWLFRLLIGVGLTTVLLLGLEGCGQGLYRLRKGRWLFEGPPPPINSLIFEHHPYLAGKPRPNTRVEQWGNTVTITEDAVRWTGIPEGEDSTRIRIACLGASTTFGVWVDDEETWPAQLQQMLGSGFEVYNYGVLGYSTAEHIVQMALTVPEKKPDIVIFYEGWADIRNYHFPQATPDYYAHGMLQYGNLGLDVAHRLTLREQIMERSGMVWLAQAFRRKIDGLLGTGPATPLPPTAYRTPDPFVDRIYRRNLHTLKQLALMQGASAYFVPQILNDRAFAGLETSRWWSPYIVDDAMPSLILHFNTLMQGVCADEACTFVDGMQEIPWANEHFVDDGHFSEEGGRRFAEVLARQILDETGTPR